MVVMIFGWIGGVVMVEAFFTKTMMEEEVKTVWFLVSFVLLPGEEGQLLPMESFAPAARNDVCRLTSSGHPIAPMAPGNGT